MQMDNSLLIGTEGARLLQEYGAGETPQERSDEEAPRHACGKRSAWSGNQQSINIAKIIDKGRNE
ncbi:hypothetical protein M3610_18040 [Neobacillus sp. MER 74]|uniref:hypothetical protein n=1 Tax=Neobacillus sp. MER 74 TaxID=2939566 RepID=UPI00203B37B8|nr:hypothetical protein [Neobacillus sp. MER 74]MCM3117179.1 hypothetical protein [Neobacillus sp. MER 74]